MRWLHCPIPDFDVPGDQFEAAWSGPGQAGEQARAILSSGGAVVCHCRGGIGRAGTIASRLLVELGVASPEEALSRVRRARPGAVETHEQERHVLACTPCAEPASAMEPDERKRHSSRSSAPRMLASRKPSRDSSRRGAKQPTSPENKALNTLAPLIYYGAYAFFFALRQARAGVAGESRWWRHRRPVVTSEPSGARGWDGAPACAHGGHTGRREWEKHGQIAFLNQHG